MESIIVGIVMLALGGVGLFFVGRREFYRRNVAGVEEFKGYGAAVTTRFVERVVRIACRLLVIFGVLILVMSFIATRKT